MATPQFHSYCCVHADSNDESPLDLAYHIICLVASVVGIVGAVVYIAYSHIGRRGSHTHRQILKWLAIYDVLGSLGIFGRSILILWGLYNHDLPLDDPPDKTNYICGMLTMCIDFFYLMTFSWTICYAWQTYLHFQDKSWNIWKYHAVSLLASVMVSIIEQFAAFYKANWKCQQDHELLTIYNLGFYIPIAITMVANPVIYIFTARLVKNKVMYSPSLEYTEDQRKQILKIKQRFLRIVIVFYACWLINVVNGIVVFVKITYPTAQINQGPIWILMAILNPMQGMLNAMVYRGCKIFPITNLTSRRAAVHSPRPPTVQDRDSLSESTSLLASYSTTPLY